MDDVDEIAVGSEGIRLGQLLKLTGAADTGGMVKALLADGAVQVNGREETRRGVMLTDGALVECHGRRWRVAVRA